MENNTQIVTNLRNNLGKGKLAASAVSTLTEEVIDREIYLTGDFINDKTDTNKAKFIAFIKADRSKGGLNSDQETLLALLSVVKGSAWRKARTILAEPEKRGRKSEDGVTVNLDPSSPLYTPPEHLDAGDNLPQSGFNKANKAKNSNTSNKPKSKKKTSDTITRAVDRAIENIEPLADFVDNGILSQKNAALLGKQIDENSPKLTENDVRYLENRDKIAKELKQIKQAAGDLTQLDAKELKSVKSQVKELVDNIKPKKAEIKKIELREPSATASLLANYYNKSQCEELIQYLNKELASKDKPLALVA